MKIRTMLFALLLCSATYSQSISWQTTREGTASGSCNLESSRMSVTIHNFHAEVEEEAVIRTTGNVWRGDESTLEIFGDFRLSSGSAVRSLLLWNGDVILKAKLKTRADADSEYEDVVDREEPDVIPIDPAIVEYLGDNRYQFKIYPVEINRSRRIRIRYTVPLQSQTENPEFNIVPVFLNGTHHRPSQIPVEFKKGDSAFESYIFQYGDSKKTIQTGATYQLSPFYNLLIQPDVDSLTTAFTHTIDDGKGAGYYTAVFTSVPDTVTGAIENEIIGRYSTMEIKVNSGEKTYITDLHTLGAFGIYLKSESEWDSTVTWTSYDDEGRTEFTYEQSFRPDTSNGEMLPFVWAAKYSLSQNQRCLGALFGFVDHQMSLLALEKDSISREDMQRYADEGVPELQPEEIIIDPEEMPSAPQDYVFFEQNPTTPVLNSAQQPLAFSVVLLCDGGVMLEFGNNIDEAVTAVLYDARGRIVHRWKNTNVNGNTLKLEPPHNMQGMYFIQIQNGKHTYRNKVILH
ncbi:MAG: T9SS type A sorting domain-containing protein [Chitinispirillaceae bacterium]